VFLVPSPGGTISKGSTGTPDGDTPGRLLPSGVGASDSAQDGKGNAGTTGLVS
jgi:hypothetical protein